MDSNLPEGTALHLLLEEVVEQDKVQEVPTNVESFQDRKSRAAKDRADSNASVLRQYGISKRPSTKPKLKPVGRE